MCFKLKNKTVFSPHHPFTSIQSPYFMRKFVFVSNKLIASPPVNLTKMVHFRWSDE